MKNQNQFLTLLAALFLGASATATFAVDVDLAVTGFSAFQPAAIAPGGHPTSITYSLHNYGPGSVGSGGGTAPILIDLWLSSNTTFGDGDDLYLGQMQFSISSPAGSDGIFTSGNVNGLSGFTIPAGANGTYQVFLQITHPPASGRVDPDLSDNTGLLSGTITVGGGGDTTPPTASSITRLNPSGQLTSAASVVYRVSFSEHVNNVSTADFTLADVSGTITGESITSVGASSGTTIDVTVNTGSSGSGDLRLDVIAPGATITDDAGNGLNASFTSGQLYTIDRAAPTVVSINRLTPSGQVTSAASVVYRVTFSEHVNNISTADFTLADVSGTITDESITSVSASSGTTIDVTVSTGSSGSGDLRLDVIVPGATITDDAANSLNASFTGGQVYSIDRTIPTAPTITTQPVSQTVSVGQSASFTVAATGTAPLNYQWRKDGVALAGATSTTYNLLVVQTNQAGSYTVVVNNSAGSFTSAPPAVLTVNLAFPAAVLAWGCNSHGQTTVPVAAQSGVTAIAARWHTVALKNDGSVVAWGYNAYGQTTVPITAQSGVAAIAAGRYHTVALKNDGSVVAWGYNSKGQTTVPLAAQSGVTAIAAGGFHTVALKNDGSVVAWGQNSYGETTVPVAAQSGVTAIAAGYSHTLALKNDGTVVAWGENSYGETTVPVAAQSGVMAIAAGYLHTVALRNDGSVVAWGDNSGGQIDVPVAAQSGVTAIAAGDSHTLALKNDGTVVGWGGNPCGETTIPVTVQGRVTAIGAGVNDTVAIFIPIAPTITTQPVSRTVNVGQNASFTVAATGFYLSYQWRKDGVNLEAATDVTYNLVNAQTNEAGNYTVVVSNIVGSVTSSVATLTVTALLPSITTQPGNRTVNVGQNASFSVVATSLPLYYQWRKEGTNLAAARNATYSLTNVQTDQAGAYTVVVSNGAGSVTSSVATLTVLTLAGALDAPNLVWTTGGNAPWTVQTSVTHDGVDAAQSGLIAVSQESWLETTVTNGPGLLSFWWKVSSEATHNLEFYINGVLQSGQISGEVNWQQQTFRLQGTNQTLRWRYVKSFFDPAGQDKGWVDQVAFVPDVLPTITTQPVSQTVNVGQSASFSVAATGGNLGYQWRKDGFNLNGATSVTNTLTSLGTNQAGDYTVVVSNSIGSVTSSVATLTVNAAPPGSVVAWGYNSQGQTTVPAGLNGVMAIAAGGSHTVALKSNGSVVAWGNNGYGETTVPVAAQSGVAAIAAGGGHTVALKNDGSVVAWGYIGSGQTTVPVEAQSGVTAIAAGGGYAVALKNDGSVVAWGDNYYGQTNVPVGLSGVTAIAAGYLHTVALKNDGSVVAWGYNGSGQTTVPVEAQSGVTAIAAGGFHTVALKNDGSVVAWGQNYNGQVTGTPRTSPPYSATASPVTLGDQVLTGVAAISAGYLHTVALKNDGSVVAWGYNAYGQTNVPAGLSGVAAIAAGAFHTVALLGSVTVTQVPPTITTQPVNQTVLVGQSASFSVTATGTAPLSYQWRKEGTNLNGATSATYSLTNVQTSQAGNYTVVVSNFVGSVTSSVATLTVNQVPTITTQPVNQTVLVGQSASFSVTATGTALLSYQWRKEGTNLNGATSASYSLANVQTSQAGNYTVVVSNFVGSVTSSVATLTVNGPYMNLPYTFVTLAGLAGQAGSNDGTGSAARFNLPQGLAVDSSGNVYVGDYANHTIRKVTGAGVVTTLAGLAGSPGTANGVGSSARFHSPLGVAVDSIGNVYVADLANDTIRKVTDSGVVTTLAGLANSGGHEDGTGEAARFITPSGVALDSTGNFYIADEGNDTIRRMTPLGAVTTLAGFPFDRAYINGTGSVARFHYPNGIAVDSSGNAYVADSWNHTIRKMTPAGVVTTVAGGGPGNPGSANGTGTDARFYYPAGVAADTNGNLYVTDFNHTIRKVTPGGEVTTVAGAAGISGATDGTGSAARFYAPYHLVVDNAGNLYVADSYNHTIRKGIPDYGQPIIYGQPQSQTVAASSSVSLYVANTGTLPLAYQWFFNGGLIAAATNASLNLQNLQLASAGNYTVVVTNNYGAATSAVATLTVNQVPTITTQPVNQAVFVGQSANFSVAATGTAPLSYQWRKAGTNLIGATNTTYSLTNVQTGQAGNYTVVVSNSVGSVTSSIAVLTVNRLTQTISFGSLPDKSVGDAPFTLSATASSGLPVSYASANPGVATVNGQTVAITGIGTTIITASQAGDATYLSASSVSQTLVVGSIIHTPLTLISTGAVWRFRDDGSDQGTAWRLPGFNASGWTAGPAPLGYGNGDEATVVAFGPDPNNKSVTTYFRHSFLVANTALVPGLVLRLRRDDGAVGYLNGVEVFRSNMPGGNVAWDTLAASTVSGAEEYAFSKTCLSPALLLNGTNVLAVEIHQISRSSSDIVFDTELTVASVQITSPVSSATFVAPAIVNISTSASEFCGTIARLEFFESTNKLGEVSHEPWGMTWNNVPAGNYVLTARATDFYGLSTTSTPVNIRVFQEPGTLVSTGSVWKYLDNGSDQGSNWRALGFDDNAWPSGAAQLGYGDGDEATVLNFGPDPDNTYITTYFRRAFIVPDTSLIPSLSLRLLRDDGVVVYLNGVEVFRDNMPAAAPVYFDTRALLTVFGDDETNFIHTSLPSSLLRNGTNVVAVEIHQAAPTSSDISFDLELMTAITWLPTLTIAKAGNSVVLAWPGGAQFYALQWADSLVPPVNWSIVPGSITFTNGTSRLLVPISPGQMYFRLFQP